MRKLTFLGFVALLMLEFSPNIAQAGSGGAVGGNDSGSNLDSSTITGGTFNFLESQSVENPLGESPLLDCTPDEQGGVDENCIPQLSPPELAQKIKEALDSSETTDLGTEFSPQVTLLTQFIANLEELTQTKQISATQFEQTIQMYNEVVNSLTSEQLVKVSQMPEVQQLKSSLLKIRALFYEKTTNNQ